MQPSGRLVIGWSKAWGIHGVSKAERYLKQGCLQGNLVRDQRETRDWHEGVKYKIKLIWSSNVMPRFLAESRLRIPPAWLCGLLFCIILAADGAILVYRDVSPQPT
jgi:hypothetical protein